MAKKKAAPQKQDEERGILAFPQIEEFYNFLMDRIYAILSRQYLNEKFVLFINALPRNHGEGTFKTVNRLEEQELTYVGIKKLRTLIEGEKKDRKVELDKDWNNLEQAIFNSEKGLINSQLYQEFKIGDLSLDDIPGKASGKLSDYFSNIIKGEGPSNEWQINEFYILTEYLDSIEEYYYLSLPLIQFVEFDGVVHIIYHRKDRNSFLQDFSPYEMKLLIAEGKVDQLEDLAEQRSNELDLQKVAGLIKAISMEYEGLILDWDIEGGITYKEKFIKDALDIKMYTDSNLDNPILSECKYFDYYNLHRSYFYDRLKISKQIPLSIRR